MPGAQAPSPASVLFARSNNAIIEQDEIASRSGRRGRLRSRHMSFTSIPFKTESTHGLTSVNGVAKFSSAGVVLEFEAKLFGLISHGVKEVRLAVAEILDVKFKKGVMRRGAKIEIRLKSFARLSEFPHNEGKIMLKIVHDDFERSRDAVEKLQKDMTDHIAQMPPTHTPVSVLFDESEDDTKELK